MTKDFERKEGMFMGHTSCEACGSSDAVAVYKKEDESVDGYCWSCEAFVKGDKIDSTNLSSTTSYVKKEPITQEQIDDIISRTTFDAQGYRGLSSSVMKFTGIRTEFKNGEVYCRYYPTHEKGELVGYKRRVHPKDFTKGPVGKGGTSCDLMGMDVHDKGGKRVLIAAGEEDYAAAVQMLRQYQVKAGRRDNKPLAVVSPLTGESGSKRQIQNNYDWLNSFEMVIIGFDNDEAGKAAAQKIAKVLPQNKVHLAEWPCKDINQCLNDKREKDFISAYFSAVKYSPSGILASSELMASVVERAYTPRIPLPPFMHEAEKMLCGGIPLGYIVNILAASGIGKCVERDTPILMYSGSIKMVQDVVVGDLLMGPEGKPRTVLNLSSGRDEMFKVSQVKGDDYTVNSNHVLSLRYGSSRKRNGWVKGDVVNIPIRDYIELPQHLKNVLKGYKGDCTELGGNADEAFEPYMLGSWLADGTSAKSQFTFHKQDGELIENFYKVCDKRGYGTNVSPSNDRDTVLTVDVKGGYYSFLNKSNLLDNKHIPNEYKISNYSDRLELLAGILDGDGYKVSNGYEITFKHEQLCEDFMFVARSVGLSVTVRDKFCKCQNFDGAWYKRVFVFGDTDKIPMKLTRKKCEPRKQVKSTTSTGITVESVGEGEYYGFEVDGDHLFMLGDFTVTHNSTIVNEVVYHWLFNSPHMTGVVSLEATAGEYYTNILSRHLGRKIELIQSPEEKVEYLTSDYVKERERELGLNEYGEPRFYLLDDRGDVKSLRDKIEYLIVVNECKVIVVDPLQDILDELPTEEEAKFMRWMKQMVALHEVTFININHARKNGGGTKANSRGAELSEEDMAGSSTIFKSGAINIILSRDKLAECPVERNSTKVVIAKARGAGNTGNAGEFYYENKEHTLVALDEASKDILRNELNSGEIPVPTDFKKSIPEAPVDASEGFALEEIPMTAYDEQIAPVEDIDAPFAIQ